MDLDTALEEPEPPAPTETFDAYNKAKYEKWHRSDKFAVHMIRICIAKIINDLITNKDHAK